MAWECKVIVVTDKDKRIGRDKAHGSEHGGPDIDMNGAAVRLIVMINGEIASRRRPELGTPKKDDVQHAEDKEESVDNHPGQ